MQGSNSKVTMPKFKHWKPRHFCKGICHWQVMYGFATMTRIFLKVIRGPEVDNVYNDNHMECLDLHLSNITLNSYWGTLPEITLAMFFLVRAKVPRVLRLNTHLIRKDQWYDYQRRLVLWNGSATKNAKLRIGRAYGKAIGSYCVKPIHDLSVANPFSEITRFEMFEFGRCNLWIWTLQYLWYLLYNVIGCFV